MILLDPFDWCCLGAPPTKEADIWHMVRPQSPTTVCGLAAANPDEEWRWTDKLGNRRPCDNCAEIIARQADVPAVGMMQADGFEPQMGCLPDTGAPRILLAARAITAAVNKVIPTSSDHMSMVPWPTGVNAMLGNATDGNCVIVAIVNAFLAQWRLFRPNDPPPVFTNKTCIDAYQAISGVYTSPGPGLDIQTALNWFRKNGIKDAAGVVHRLLCFMAGPPDLNSIREGIWEFGAVVCAANMYAGQMYSAVVHTLVWDPLNQGAAQGGHAFLGGAFVEQPDYIKVRTWALTVGATDAFIARNFQRAVWYPIFEDLWPHYGYDRQVQCVTDLQAITGETWSGPAPVDPSPAPLPEATVQLLTKQFRIFDGPLAAGVTKAIQVAGVGPIPANATGVVLALRVVSPTAASTIYLGGTTFDFPAGATPNGWPTLALSAIGDLSATCANPVGRFVVDVLGFLV